MYTTVTNVRKISGFYGNSNVSDSFISSLIIRAEGLVNSYLADVYTMPLGKYYTRTIVFSGTGSGASTMTITIDGVDYDIVMAVGLTASQAADLFRTAIIGNTSFITDGLGSGATVTLYTIDSDDSTQITITSTDPQTVSGVTATSSTITEISVPMVEYLTAEIATAYLLLAEYGPESQDTDKDGAKRLALAREILTAIRNKEEKILSFAGIELDKSATKTISFFPTTGSTDLEGKTVENKFTMNKKF